jgi:uncharacterized protein (DUF2062 family)
MNPKRWLRKHSLKLLAIRDTPEAIAGGVAIGIFFGFTPLFGLKTALAVLFAWLTGSNILAAVIAGALHDIILPFMPMIYRWEYDVGFWLLSQPHHWPPSLVRVRLRWEGHSWHDWTTFFTVGKPLLIGSFVVGAPFTIAAYLISRGVVHRHQVKRAAREARAAAPPELEDNPS